MKRILFVFSFCFTLFTVYCQNFIGFKIGGNTNDVDIQGINTSIIPSANSYTGLSAGLTSLITLDKNFSFRSDLSYTQKGFSVSQGTSFEVLGIDVPIGATLVTKVNYLDITPQLQYDYKSQSGFHAYGFAGPCLAYGTTASIQTKTNFILDFNIYRTDLDLSNDSYNRWDFGISGGAGIGGKIGSGEVFAEVKYNHGFSDQLGNNLIDLGVKNRSINYGVGYRFSL